MNLPNNRTTGLLLTALNGVLALPLLVYAYGALFVRYANDDFCAAVVLRENGLVGALGWWYTYMHGRFAAELSIAAAIGAGQSFTPIPTIVVLIIWWLALIGTAYLLVGNHPYRVRQSTILASLILLGLFASAPNLSRVLYWYSGTLMYLAGQVVSTIYAWVVLQRFIKNETVVLLLCVFLSILATWFSELQGLVHGIIIVVVYLLYARQQTDSHLRRRLLAGLAGVAFALVFSLTAPGNRVRGEFLPTPNLGNAITGTIASPASAGIIFFQFTPLIAVALLILPALAAYYAPYQANVGQRATRYYLPLTALGTYTLVMACFAPTFYFLSAPLGDHGWAFPLFILICGLVAWAYASGLALQSPRTRTTVPMGWMYVAGFLIVAGSVASTSHALNYVSRLRSYAEAWDRRDQQMQVRVRAGEGSPPVGPFTNPYDDRIKNDPSLSPLAIDSLRKESLTVWEITEDPNNWVNKCVARYYNVAAVVAKDSP